jgi:hypothetical protein
VFPRGGNCALPYHSVFGCNLSCEDETVQSDRANGRFEGPRHRAEDPVDSDEIEDGLVELGKHTGLSGRRCLSKIERGQLFPTLATLLRIALALSVGLDYFILAERDTPVVGISRHQERMRFPEKAGARIKPMNSSRSTFPLCNGC